MSKAEAIKDFEKKFRSKTRNKWSDRSSFKPAPGKYTLIDMADDDETDAPVVSLLSAWTTRAVPVKLFQSEIHFDLRHFSVIV